MNSCCSQLLTTATTLGVLALQAAPGFAFSFDLPAGFDQDLATKYNTSIYTYSQRGDYIGRGREWFYGPADGQFALTGNSGKGLADLSFNNRNVVNFFDSTRWRGRFSAPFGQPLKLGYYDGATRYPFQDIDVPGLSFTGDGRGCNRSGGRFEVLDLGYDNAGLISSFDAVFAQYCENETATGTPALFGRVRYNVSPDVPDTDIPDTASVPEPSLILGIVTLGIGIFKLKP